MSEAGKGSKQRPSEKTGAYQSAFDSIFGKPVEPGCKCEPGDCVAMNSMACRDRMKRSGK
jgi:hypothetical protein